ncbi:MAG: glycosyltransferase [Bacteroidetes bacterium]|nr:glycosyltransferase [Bacteroidota bacterium]
MQPKKSIRYLYSPMHILLLSKKNPYPERDGEAIAIMQLAKGLAQNGCKVSILYMNTPKHHFPVSEIPGELTQLINFYAVNVNNAITPIGALQNLFVSTPYHVQRFFSSAYLAALRQLIANNHFDIIQAEGLYLTQYFNLIRKPANTRFVYRSHNIESEIWGNIATNTSNSIKKWYLQIQTKKLADYEKTIPQNIDAIVPISIADFSYYQQITTTIPLHHTPTGIELDQSPIASAVDFNTLYFLGGLDWLPNIEGLEWFIHEIFPKIIKILPETTLHIAGRNGDERWKQLHHPQIKYHGEVENAQKFAADKYICIVPLLSGSGMKIKIIEAMHLGKPVVTTPKGAKGMPTGTGLHFYTAADAQQFADIVIDLLQSPEKVVQKTKLAQQFVDDNLSHLTITQALIHFYQKISA